MTPEQLLLVPVHIERWRKVATRLGPPDRPAFEEGARRCYEYAGIPWHDNVIWVTSPQVFWLAAPAAVRLAEADSAALMEPFGEAVRRVLGEEVWSAVWSAVQRAAVKPARSDDFCSVLEAVEEEVCCSVFRAVERALGQNVVRLLDLPQRDATGLNRALSAVIEAVLDVWFRVIPESGPAVLDFMHTQIPTVGVHRRGAVYFDRAMDGWTPGGWARRNGQLWRPASVTFAREAAGVALPGDLWDRSRAYERTLQAGAFFWYPHRDFLMVCERPREMHLEPVQWRPPGQEPQLHSRLHRDDGPALSWPDGWAVHAVHGCLVPGWIIERPQDITRAAIDSTRHPEVQRIMIERYGWPRYLAEVRGPLGRPISTRVETLTAGQAAQLPVHAARWLRIALDTSPADRAGFEAAARQCYEYAGIAWHGHVIWVSSPLVLALAAWMATVSGRVSPPEALTAEMPQFRRAACQGLGETLWAAVEAAALRAVAAQASRGSGPSWTEASDAIREAVYRKPFEANATPAAVGEASGAAQSAFQTLHANLVRVHQRIIGWAVSRAAEAIGREGGSVVQDLLRGLTGMLHGPVFRSEDRNSAPDGDVVFTSYFREVCGLVLPGDLEDRSRAYERTFQSAGWWFPHNDFLMVCERPREIHLEQVRRREEGRDGQLRDLRLPHRDDGPALSWSDGWALHAVHGRLVPRWIIEHPERITLATIESEANTEMRRAMLDRYGWARYLADSGAAVVDTVPMDHEIRGLRGARLLVKRLPGEPEPVVYLEMCNSTPEPDGSHRRYLERIDPKAYDGDARRWCHAAMASRWFHRDGDGNLQRTFERWQDYRPDEES